PAHREPFADDGDAGPRPTDLEAHHQRQCAANEEKDHPREKELDADDLVGSGEDVLPQETQFRVGMRPGLMTYAHGGLLSRYRETGEPGPAGTSRLPAALLPVCVRQPGREVLTGRMHVEPAAHVGVA